ASANAFSLSKTYNQISQQLGALGAVFAAPQLDIIAGHLKTQQFREWSFQIQQQLSNSFLFTVGYFGNSGRNIPYLNQWANAFDPGYGIYPNTPQIPTGNPRVANYGTVQEVQSGAVSSYNGVTATITKRFTNWVTGHASYTWSHTLDEVSNGGVFTYGDSIA